MGCGASGPARVVQPSTIGPPALVPHHPEVDPSDLYKVVLKRPDRIKTLSPRQANAHSNVNTKSLTSPYNAELHFSGLPEVKSPNHRDSGTEQVWETSTSASTGRLPRHTLAAVLRSVFDYLPSTVNKITINDCEAALGNAFRRYPAFMPEDEFGNIASAPKTGTNEENAKKDMKAWIMATSFDRPATPVGHCAKEPSQLSKAFTETYLHVRARINDHMRSDDNPPPQKRDNKEKDSSSDEVDPKPAAVTPRGLLSPRATSAQRENGQTSGSGRPASLQLSPLRSKKVVGNNTNTFGSPANNTTHDNVSNSFVDRDTIRFSQDVLLEDCEPSDQESMAHSVEGSSVSPSTIGLGETVSHGGVSSGAGRPLSPTKTLRSIQAFRAARDIGMSKNKKKLSERISSWIELGLLTLFEDPTNEAPSSTQATRSISQTAAPLSSANLSSLQSQLHALRARAAQTTLHPSPDNDDFFMNVPSAICWYYGSEPFYPDTSQPPSILSQLLPPCVLRYPYNNVYGFAIARTADISRKAALKLSSIVAREGDHSIV